MYSAQTVHCVQYRNAENAGVVQNYLIYVFGSMINRSVGGGTSVLLFNVSRHLALLHYMYYIPQVATKSHVQYCTSNYVQQNNKIFILKLRYSITVYVNQIQPKCWIGYGSTDLRLDISTEKSKFNQQIYQSMLRS